MKRQPSPCGRDERVRGVVESVCFASAALVSELVSLRCAQPDAALRQADGFESRAQRKQER